MSAFQPAKNNLLHTEVISGIIDAIVVGDLKPGDRIIEQYIAQQMKISRAPVREAIRELVTQGILKFIPRKGAYVAPLILEDVQAVYLLRSRLEGLTARLAVKHLAEDDLAKLASFNQQMEQATLNNDAKSFVDNDIAFHNYITNHCGQTELIKMIAGVQIQTRLFMVMSKWHLVAHAQLNKESNAHRPILEAFYQGDQDLAERRMQHHIEMSGQLLLGYIHSQEGIQLDGNQ